MANDDRNVELRIDMGGDAPEKLRALAAAMEEAGRAFDQLQASANATGDVKFLDPITKAQERLKGIVNRNVTELATDYLDPDRSIRGEDPRERRRYNAAMRNQETSRRRDVAVQTQEELQEFGDVREGVGSFISETESETALESRRYNAARRNQEVSRRRDAVSAARQAAADAANEASFRDRQQQEAKEGIGSFIADQEADASADVSNRDWSARVRHGREAAFAKMDTAESDADRSNHHWAAQVAGRRRAAFERDEKAYNRRSAAAARASERQAKEQPKRGLFGGRGMGRMGRYGGRFLAIYAASAAIRGLEKGLEDFTDKANRGAVASANFGHGMDALLGGMLKQLPIVGGAIAAFGNVEDIVSGRRETQQLGERGREEAGVGFSVEDNRTRLTARARAEVRERTTEVNVAQARSGVADRFAAYMAQPGVAQSFNQSFNANAAPFTTSTGLDAARLAVARQQSAVDAAREERRVRGEDASQAEERVAAARERYFEAARVQGGARNQRELAQAGLNDVQGDAFSEFAYTQLGATSDLIMGRRGEYLYPAQQRQLRLNQSESTERNAANNTRQASLQLGAEQESRTRAVAEAEKAITRENEQQAKLKQMQVEVDRQRLDLLKQERSEAGGREQSFGDMTQAQRLSAVFAARQFNQFGYENLSPEQRSTLRRLYPSIFSRVSEAAGRNSAEFGQLQGEANQFPFQGQEGEGVRGTAPIDRKILGTPAAPGQPAVPGLAAQATIQMAVNEAEAERVMTAALQKSLKTLEPRLIEVVQDKINDALVEFARKQTQGKGRTQ